MAFLILIFNQVKVLLSSSQLTAVFSYFLRACSTVPSRQMQGAVFLCSHTAQCWPCPERSLRGRRFPVFSSWPRRTRPHAGPETWPAGWAGSGSGATLWSRCWPVSLGCGSEEVAPPVEIRPGSPWPSSVGTAKSCYWTPWHKSRYYRVLLREISQWW